MPIVRDTLASTLDLFQMPGYMDNPCHASTHMIQTVLEQD